MSNLSQFFGGSLWSQPTIWVQDKKTGDIDAGYMDSASTLYTRDLNRIVYNSLGASLVNDGTTSSAVGAVGTQTIVNNPSTGVHNTSSHVILASGTYVYKLETNIGKNIATTINLLYDKTAGADLAQNVVDGQAGQGAGYAYFKQEGVFTLSSTSNVDVRTAVGSVTSSSTANMGTGNALTSSVNIVHTDLILHKIA